MSFIPEKFKHQDNWMQGSYNMGVLGAVLALIFFAQILFFTHIFGFGALFCIYTSHIFYFSHLFSDVFSKPCEAFSQLPGFWELN
jgi:hypothetical protein